MVHRSSLLHHGLSHSRPLHQLLKRIHLPTLLSTRIWPLNTHSVQGHHEIRTIQKPPHQILLPLMFLCHRWILLNLCLPTGTLEKCLCNHCLSTGLWVHSVEIVLWFQCWGVHFQKDGNWSWVLHFLFPLQQKASQQINPQSFKNFI